MNLFPVTGKRPPLPSVALYERYVSEGTGVWPLDPAEAEDGAREDPLFLDPCVDQRIEDHLRANIDGSWTPISDRGAATVEHFNLNRETLVREREQAVLKSAVLTAPKDFLSVDNSRDDFTGFLTNLARQQTGELPPPDIFKTGAEPPALPEGMMLSLGTLSSAISPDLLAEVIPEPAPYIPPPTLTRVEIRGFKGIERLDLDLPPPADGRGAARLILGENSAGKSSLLEAIALALAAPPDRRALDISAKDHLLDPAQMGSRLEPRKTGVVRLTLQDAAGAQSQLLLKLTPRGFRTEGARPETLPVFAYGAYRHYRQDNHDWTPGRGILTLFRNDKLLSNPGKWLLRLPEDRFNEVVAALRFIFGPGGDFERIERSDTACMVITKKDDDEIATPLDAVSSGFRTMLALSCDVMRWLIDDATPWRFPSLKSARGLLLIDEVEAHLHPRWKVQVMDGLRRALPGMTLIATTHDPLCLRGMDKGEVLVLRRIPGEAAGSALPVKVDALIALPDVRQLTIEQLLKSDFFALYDTDDPRAGAAMADLVDALSGLDATDPAKAAKQAELIEKFRGEVTEALPVGRSEVSMLVQEAVADYLRDQSSRTEENRRRLRDETRARIVAILKGDRDAPR
ncbi:AAA family ATPase [Rhodobacter viridis]|nr:AAA family ATPase [Rhodobacter viridis]